MNFPPRFGARETEPRHSRRHLTPPRAPRKLRNARHAPREALTGTFLAATTREGFRIAHEVSSYSLTALAQHAQPLMAGGRGALLTLTYLGAERSIPGYNVMGLAKASLEASVRFLAADLGPEGIRVNEIGRAHV